jgi:23S rRNA (adenine2503-C2)-methyltransferase
MQSLNRTSKNLLDFSREEMRSFITGIGIEAYRSDQIFKGLYSQRHSDFTQFTTLSKQLRSTLNEAVHMRSFTLQDETRSPKDRTTKYLWRLADGLLIESVIIYEGKRITFCISSQVGCALDCKFCATGKMGFLRNLSSGEIVEQVLLMMEKAEGKPTNIVFMGMGEPMLNLRNVIKASDILADPEGLCFARKKITISTSGIASGIRKFADSGAPYSLAVSLNAVFEEKRRMLMPVSNQFPLDELKEAIQYYVSKTGRRVSFEYILIAGINDTKADAERLVKFTNQFPCKINLIPCNSNDPAFPPPSQEHVIWFSDYIDQRRRTVTVRLRKGWEIQAACGQLYTVNSAVKGAKISV